MTKPIVVLTDESIGPEARARLGAAFDVRALAGLYPSEAILARACAEASAILARLAVVTRGVIEAAPRLRIVSRHGVGVDAVDLDAATEHGIVVTTTGSANAAAVAEYTFALLLAHIRHITAADASMRRGEWSRGPLVGLELEGKTLGILGLGAIGRRVARQGLGFGMRVLAHDPRLERSPIPEVELMGLPHVLAQSDIITLHTRLDASTQGLIGAAAIAAMKPTAILINTSRGDIIDEPALIAALRQGRLAGAILDTFDGEPLANDSPLRAMPNVLLSPHVAGQTHEALARVGLAAADAIIDELAGRRPAHVFNPQAYDRRAERNPRAQ
jgi:D-3-phosphoglycerate dehydrogenase / 2-oxoglutarate reductase